MTRPSRIGCAVAAAANLPWAWAGSASFTVPSAGWPNSTNAPFGALGTFFTNDPPTFATDPGGINVLRGGFYVSFHFGNLQQSAGITQATVVGRIFARFDFWPSSVDTLNADIVNPALNASLTGPTPDASPQRWLPSTFVAVNIPEVGPTFPLGPWGVKLNQQSGSDATGTADVFIVRIADGIP